MAEEAAEGVRGSVAGFTMPKAVLVIIRKQAGSGVGPRVMSHEVRLDPAFRKGKARVLGVLARKQGRGKRQREAGAGCGRSTGIKMRLPKNSCGAAGRCDGWIWMDLPNTEGPLAVGV